MFDETKTCPILARTKLTSFEKYMRMFRYIFFDSENPYICMFYIKASVHL